MRNEDRLPRWRSALADYPFTSHFMDQDGHAMHYLDEGPRNAPPVLMVHGNPTWSFYWRHLVRALATYNRAIAIDHMGCGLSDKPAGVKYTLDLRIRHLSRLVRELDLKEITLVVHDWGGAIGLGAALEDLGRYCRFVLLNTAAFPPPFFPLRIRACRIPFFGKLAVQGFNLFARAAVRMATEQPGGLPHDVASGLLAPSDSWRHRRAIYEFVRDIPTRESQPTMQRLAAIENGLARIDGRHILLLWGMKDWCFRPECLDRFRTIWPAAKTIRFAGAGHYLMEDAREEVISAVREFAYHRETDSVRPLPVSNRHTNS
jgi:cis-3-alkyl-4-acyloxetan-2-one decarboxylase